MTEEEIKKFKTEQHYKDLLKSSQKGLVDLIKMQDNKIAALEKELESEKKLNEEIKVRFVKCNTCTDEMKGKCLMFSENLCEGERCTELVDLMSLINKEHQE